ncbi:MAG: hypothetical protein WCI74_12845 [Actinomycetes bacterium]
MRQFRDLLTDGYRDAVEQTGSGLAPTFPADTWLPTVITIDHVLTRNAVASSIMAIHVAESDHRFPTGKHFGAHQPGVARLANRSCLGQKSPMTPFGWQTASPWFNLQQT